MKGAIMRNLCGTIFYIKTNVLPNLRIYMSVPLRGVKSIEKKAKFEHFY